MDKRWLICGAALAFCAVATGALGDHLIRTKLFEWFPSDAAKRFETWQVASRYLFYHALAICLVGLLPFAIGRGRAHIAGFLFLLGIVLFSGCLFAYTITDHKWLLQLVPFGGGSFLLGWLGFIIAAASADRISATSAAGR